MKISYGTIIRDGKAHPVEFHHYAKEESFARLYVPLPDILLEELEEDIFIPLVPKGTRQITELVSAAVKGKLPQIHLDDLVSEE